MNYFAHGIRFLDRPYFLVGSAIPDLLNVVNRKSRVRQRTIDERLGSFSGDERELALGIRQHLRDDHWFHSTAGFFEVTGSLSELFRAALGPDEVWHCGFLGHIVTELLMDAVLTEDHPGVLQQYYDVFATVDSERVQHTVSSLASVPPLELARFLELFVQERFLEDYTNNDRLLHRLNQVMRRIGIRVLPRESVPVLEQGRELVRSRMTDLLPVKHFPETNARWVLPRN